MPKLIKHSKDYLDIIHLDTAVLVQGTFITPSKYGKNSSLMPDDIPTDKNYVSIMLRNEFDRATVTLEPPERVLKKYFSSEKLTGIANKTFEALDGTSYINGKWVFAPSPDRPSEPGEKEKEMQLFLQNIINVATKVNAGIEPERIWTADFAELPLDAAEQFERRLHTMTVPLTDDTADPSGDTNANQIAGPSGSANAKKTTGTSDNTKESLPESNPGKKKGKRRKRKPDDSEKRRLLGAFEDTEKKRKPDLLAARKTFLTDQMKTVDQRLKWKFIALVAELRFGKAARSSEIYMEVAQKALCMFEAQWNRRFLYTLGFVRERIFLSIFNRAGVIHCTPFDIHLNPEIFVHLIVALAFCTDTELGFDPTVVVGDSDYRGTYIIIDGLSYKIIQSVWKSHVVAGRATQCFIVTRNGKYYVVKDVWVTRFRRPTEYYLFKKAMAAGVRNIPGLVKCVNVKINNARDITETGSVDVPLTERIHRRYLFEDCGLPIWTFHSIKELLSAFIDILIAHKDLYFKAGILHRDISIWNFMLLIDASKLLENQAILPVTSINF